MEELKRTASFIDVAWKTVRTDMGTNETKKAYLTNRGKAIKRSIRHVTKLSRKYGQEVYDRT